MVEMSPDQRGYLELAFEAWQQVNLLVERTVPAAPFSPEHPQSPVDIGVRHFRVVAQVVDFDCDAVGVHTVIEQIAQLRDVGTDETLISVYPEDPLAPALLEAGVA